MMKKMNPIQRFSLLCFLFVLMLVALTGAAISHYAKKVFLEREGRLASEFVQAHWTGLFSGPDFQLSGKMLEELESIRNVPEVVNAKLYNRGKTVVWSTRREIVGKAFPQNNELERALRGETVVVLEAIRRKDHGYLKDYYDELVEIYTPIIAGGGNYEVTGVLSLYKSAAAIQKSIGEINRWIWFIAAGSGFLLYVSLFGIFHATYKKQKKTEDSLKDINERLETLVEEKTSDLKKSLDTVQTVLDSIDDCIIVHDLSHTILAGNRTASMAFDKDRKSALGKKCHALFVGKDEPCSNCPVKEVMARKTAVAAQILDIRTEEAISVVVHPILDESGKIVSLLEYADFLSGENPFEKRWGLSIVEAASRTPEIDFISHNKKMKEIAAVVGKIACLPSPVLLNGETGTGKEVIAKLIHHSGGGRKGPFIAVNCGALSESLLESTLFGYEKGAFTGAIRTQKGYIEEASGGTLFLDEITETSPKLQASLLRVLEEKALHRVGSTKRIAVDFRLITATNRDVEKMVREGAFRQDLFYRINVITLSLPPLRERVEDIAPLAQHFLRKFNREFNKKIGPFSPGALDILEMHPWKGNVRELKNVLERVVSFKPVGEIVPEDFPSSLKTDIQKEPTESDNDRGGGISLYLNLPFNKAKSLFEKRYIESMLKRTGGNIIRAADISGIKKQNLYGKIKRYEIKNQKE